MSLLLEALRKAEARQNDRATDAQTKSESSAAGSAIEQLRAETQLELEALNAAQADAATAATRRSETMPARRTISGSPGPGTGRFSRLSFPLVLAGVLVIGGLAGAAVLYRSYAGMPSALVVPRNSPPPGDAAPVQSIPQAPPRAVAQIEVPIEVPLSTPVHAPISAPLSPPLAVVSPAPVAQAAAPQKKTREPAAFQRIQQDHEELTGSLEAAHQALQRGERAAATEHYQRAVQLDRNNLDALLGLGYLAQQGGQSEQAEAYFKRALAIDPRDAYALAALASLAAAQGSGAHYESRLKNSLPSQNDNSAESAAMQFALGNTLAAQQRWDEAQQAYFKAAAAQPRNPDYLFNLAVSLDQLHQPRLALEYYRKALALTGSEASAHSSAHFSREQTQQRVRALEQAQ